MEKYDIKNQAELIRTFVNDGIDYINAVNRKKSFKEDKKYDEQEFHEYITKAIDTHEEGNGFHEELKQKLSPLKLSILILENHLNDPENLSEKVGNVQEAFDALENLVKQHFEEPKLIRFVKHVDILYIEDNPLERKTVKTFFQTMGLSIKSVETSEEGLYLLNVLTPKVILVDIKLKTSNINGDEFCRIVKSISEYSSIPIVLISAVVSEHNKREIMIKTGADDIIIKPINKLSDLHVLLKYLEES